MAKMLDQRDARDGALGLLEEVDRLGLDDPTTAIPALIRTVLLITSMMPPQFHTQIVDEAVDLLMDGLED
jgi:hypothetical protein